MKLASKVYGRVIHSIWRKLKQFNFINVSDRGAISDKAILDGCTLVGDITVGDYAKIAGGVELRGRITIGRNTSVNGPNTDMIAKIHSISVGNFCSIARNVVFQEFNHRYRRLSSYYMFRNIFGEEVSQDIDSKGAIEVGHDVWIGVGCVILSGATIGHGAIIAANSVVSSDIPPYSVAGGTPARVIKPRFEPAIVDKLLRLAWWNWSHERIKRNRHLFEGELTLEKLDLIY